MNQSGWAAGFPIVYVQNSSSPGEDTTLNESFAIASEGNWSTLDTNDWLCKTGGIDWTDCGRYDGPDILAVGGVLHAVGVFDTMRSCQGDSGGPILGSSRGW